MTISPEATETGVQSSAAEDVFVARQPIFDCDKRVYAYELLFRDGLENVCSIADSHRAASHVLQAAWLTFGLPALIGQNRAFVNFSRDLLLAGYGETLPVESVVIELLETIDGDADVVEACTKLKRSGYLVALDDFVYRAELGPLLEIADIVKIRFRDSDPAEQAAHVRRLAPHTARLLAEAVETQEEYDQAVGLGFTYFQGYFFCRPQIIKGRALSGSRLTYLKLLQAVTAPALNIAELDRIIQADVSIAHRLMKYLGSASFSFRGTVTSVRQGLVLLGKEQTRRWVSLIALAEMGRDKPQEVLVSAAVRAKHCELIGGLAGMESRRPDLFLLGALSLVDVMLDQPMSEVLAELPLANDLAAALEGRSTTLRPVLELVLNYERGNWTTCSEISAVLGVPEAAVFQRYREAVSWATTALQG